MSKEPVSTALYVCACCNEAHERAVGVWLTRLHRGLDDPGNDQEIDRGSGARAEGPALTAPRRRLLCGCVLYRVSTIFACECPRSNREYASR
jgi:hypothetical protein